MPAKTQTDDLLTTGMCAKIARCAPRTITKWIDSGRLSGFRLPGSTDRRVHRPVLLRFLRNNGYPTDGDGVLVTNPPVLVFGQSESVVAGLTAAFAAVGVGVTPVPAGSGADWFRFGLLVRDLKPAAVVLDDSWGIDVVRAVAASVAGRDNPPFVVLFRDPSAELTAEPGVRASFHAPADPAAVVRVVVGGKRCGAAIRSKSGC